MSVQFVVEWKCFLTTFTYCFDFDEICKRFIHFVACLFLVEKFIVRFVIFCEIYWNFLFVIREIVFSVLVFYCCLKSLLTKKSFIFVVVIVSLLIIVSKIELLWDFCYNEWLFWSRNLRLLTNFCFKLLMIWLIVRLREFIIRSSLWVWLREFIIRLSLWVCLREFIIRLSLWIRLKIVFVKFVASRKIAITWIKRSSWFIISFLKIFVFISIISEMTIC